jgi:hypothetical protein
MSAPDPRVLQRFSVMLEHLIEHSRSHGEELAQNKALFAADPVVTPLFDRAIADLAAAQSALDALLAGIGPTVPHAHDHAHPHSH